MGFAGIAWDYLPGGDPVSCRPVILRKDRGYKHIRTGMPVVLVPRFISRTQLRYRYGRSLYRVGLISFCLAAWNGWLGSGPEGSVLPEGEQLYICLKGH